MSQAVNLPYSQACERNKDIILETIKEHLSEAETVLEIGTGTAQHALHFAQNYPSLSWQTSDQFEHLEGIRAQLKINDVPNVLPPFELDVKQEQWVSQPRSYDIVYTANSLHIMCFAEVEKFFSGLEQVTEPGSCLIVYGPFKYNGEFTSTSNLVFDQSLRSRGSGSAIRDFERINELACAAGFKLVRDISMPANNQCLIWNRG